MKKMNKSAFYICFFFLINIVNVFSQENEPSTSIPENNMPPPPPEKDNFTREPSNDFIKEWEKMMGDFVPEDIKTFMVNAYETDVTLVHEVSTIDVDKPFKGAYFIHNQVDLKTEVKIFNPKGKSMVKSQTTEGIFDFNCSLAGTYHIIILNKARKNFKITLATHFYNEKPPVNEEVNSMELKLDESLRQFKSLVSESKFGEQQRKSQTAFVEGAYNRIFILSIFETLIIMAVTGAQIYFIERLLNNKITV